LRLLGFISFSAVVVGGSVIGRDRLRYKETRFCWHWLFERFHEETALELHWKITYMSWFGGD